MIETAVLLEPHRKAVRLVHHPTIMVVIGVGAFLLFVSKTVGAQELSTGTVDTSGRASMVSAGSVILPLQRRTAGPPRALANG